MSAVVVDASIGVKWFVPEIHSAETRQWRGSGHELHVPEFFFDLEIAAVLWKKIQRSEITRQDADQNSRKTIVHSRRPKFGRIVVNRSV